MRITGYIPGRLLAWPVLAALFLVLPGCMSYHARQSKFLSAYNRGDLEQAERLLTKKGAKNERGKNRMLYFLNLGVVHTLQGEYAASNMALEQAHDVLQAQVKDPALIAATLLSNKELLAYQPERHEIVALYFYKTLNYLMLDNLSAALVECRRLNIELQRLGQQQGSYTQDAFAHLLMGIVYEANREYDQAFVAYRNAYNIYKENDKLYPAGVPEQLKLDLMRAAWLSGFDSELNFYERQFGLKHQPRPGNPPQLVFFWLNGLTPVKQQWSINFVVSRTPGYITFTNLDLGWSFTFPHNNDSTFHLEFVRVAVPRYLERPLFYTSGSLLLDGASHSLHEAENVAQLARVGLNDRLYKELAESLLRLFVKKSAEYALRKQSEGAGTVLSLANMLTENADTRNWQTLPSQISYARVPMKEGENVLTLVQGPVHGGQATEQLRYNAKPRHTHFGFYHSLSSFPTQLFRTGL